MIAFFALTALFYSGRGENGNAVTIFILITDKRSLKKRTIYSVRKIKSTIRVFLSVVLLLKMDEL